MRSAIRVRKRGRRSQRDIAAVACAFVIDQAGDDETLMQDAGAYRGKLWRPVVRVFGIGMAAVSLLG